MPIEYTSSDVSVYQKRYSGNVEYESFANDTTVQVRIHNAEGYVAATLSNDHLITTTYNYYRRDHLGNIVSVWDATNDTTVQRTFYYATGMPMSGSRGRSKQPYLYNGKEYEQVHGYNVYDFGARGYYAAVARFTSIDPLAENTPWQSPYNYASNNFIAEIDWMGLGDVYTTNNQDAIASLLGYLSNGGSLNDYDFNEEDGWIDITEDVHRRLTSLDVFFSINYWERIENSEGTGPFVNQELLLRGYHLSSNMNNAEISASLLEISQYVLSSANAAIGSTLLAEVNPFFWIGKNGNIYDISKRFGTQRYVYNRSYQLAVKRLSLSKIGKINKILVPITVGAVFADVSINGLNLGNSINIAMVIVGFCGPWGLLISTSYGIVDIGMEYFTGTSMSDRLSEYVIINRTW